MYLSMKTTNFIAPQVKARYLAHDLASPLSVIKLNLEMLNLKGRRTILVKRAFSGLEQIEARLAQELNGDDPVAKSSWKLSELLHDVIVFTSQSLAENKIELSTNIQADQHIYGPRNIFFFCCYNLIHNAVDALATKKSGTKRLLITAYYENECLVIDFSDNGPGVPVQKQALLFKKRFTTKTSGHGYGLPAVARNLSQYFNARITYQKSSLGGASFKISF